MAYNMQRADLLPRKLNQEEIYEAFDFECALRIKCIEVLEQTDDQNLESENLVQRCYIRDRIWKALQIETEEYNLAIAQYKLENEEYVLNRLEEVEKRVSEHLRERLIQPLFQNPQDDESQLDQFDTREDESGD